MKETGIIMSGNHPVDILEGRKTMTRRTRGLKEINRNPDAWEHFGFDQAGRYSFRWIGGDRILNIRCPYGQFGDLLWVRETWWEDSGDIYYKSDCPTMPTNMYFEKGKWKSSMFMSRIFSRITREITEVRVERLHDITPEDAMREGGYTVESYIQTFLTLNHIKKDRNPWNWVIGFKNEQ